MTSTRRPNELELSSAAWRPHRNEAWLRLPKRANHDAAMHRGSSNSQLGDLSSGSRRYVDLDACMPEHFDESVHTEPTDLAPGEVTDTRLTYSKKLGCPRLRETLALNDFPESVHEISTHFEILRLRCGKSEVRKHIAVRPPKLGSHLSHPPRRLIIA
jgi:hypothetical protein